MERINETPTVDLRVLVIAADGAEPGLQTIQQTLDYLGTPYTVLKLAPQHESASTDRLTEHLYRGQHAFCHGVILTTGALSYLDGDAWQSALTPAEWQALWDFESSFGVRQVTWYTYPTPDFGFQPEPTATRADGEAVQGWLTRAGREVFAYVNASSPLIIANASVYLAMPLDSLTTPLLVDDAGHALAAVRTYPDGRQNLAVTFDSSPHLVHSLVLAYGLVNWVTKGLFIGERQLVLTAQVDDIFLSGAIRDAGSPCDAAGLTSTYQLSEADFWGTVAWQRQLQSDPLVADVSLELAFCGAGADSVDQPDDLNSTIQSCQQDFKWVSHTYAHTSLDDADYGTTEREVEANLEFAARTRLRHFSSRSLVTPSYTGLTNRECLRGAADHGVRYVVCDSSQPGWEIPAPNLAIQDPREPRILILPRRPSNLRCDVSTPEEWTAAYNCTYRDFWHRDLDYREILDRESSILLAYLLRGEQYPWMFHQANLRSYDGPHSLLSDLLSLTIEKVRSLVDLPIVSPGMDELGQRMAERAQYQAADVSARLVDGSRLVLSARHAARVPVTGLGGPYAQEYGGQPVSHVEVGEGGEVTVPLVAVFAAS